MRSLICRTGVLIAGLLAGIGQCAPSPLNELEARIPGSCNTATNRACWSPGYDINTDYETKTPPGVVKIFNWEVKEYDNWVGPDGRMKSKVMLINGQYPGPTLQGNWGDTLVINVRNRLRLNGTSIHWHGIRQMGTNIQDGVNGVTECPIPPGGIKTYRFKLTQYGTTWYHSHFTAQYGNGVFGSIVVNGPASSNYDIDLGAYPINDYYLKTADELVVETMHTPAPPASDNVLFNGANINPAGTGGAYSRVTLTPNKRHRLRLINPSVEHNFQVSIVGHNMTVIQTDLVPVKPITTSNVFLGIGQRLDVIIEASNKPGNYWMNVTLPAANACGSSLNTAPAAIVQYANAPKGNPTDPGTVPPNPGCRDSLDYAPIVTRQAALDQFAASLQNTLDVTLETSPLVIWKVNNSAININWDRPILDYVLQGNTAYPTSENVVMVNQKNVWTYWVIENLSPVPHPMHLHGHDFLVLGASEDNAGTFNPATDKAKLASANPTRRDVTMLPPNGWIVLSFRADNPGNWLFHCHIAWHVSGGLAVDFLERVPEQKAQISLADRALYETNCAAWRHYYDNSGIVKIDSGL
ncbi:multicopper oxidase-domain-containing protein [Astrocystis sublimbata]|nr:multicopper oxidase-domain-containing protein [Astrocystis sublimbata]